MRAIEDARALAHSDDLPDKVAHRVVPGFCRAALEASFIRMVRARRLAKGVAHADVEDALAGATRLTSLAALALFDDAQRGGDVLRHLHNKYGAWAATAFKRCKEGAHEGYEGRLNDLVRDTDSLCRKLVSR